VLDCCRRRCLIGAIKVNKLSTDVVFFSSSSSLPAANAALGRFKVSLCVRLTVCLSVCLIRSRSPNFLFSVGHRLLLLPFRLLVGWSGIPPSASGWLIEFSPHLSSLGTSFFLFLFPDLFLLTYGVFRAKGLVHTA
jgi:hypothetical protein